MNQPLLTLLSGIKILLSKKQNKLIAGDNIIISEDNIISAAASSIVEQIAPTVITLEDNTEYELTEVSNLAISFPSGKFCSAIHLFSTSTGFQTISFPASEKHVGSFPDIQAGEEWLIIVCDGIIFAGKVESTVVAE